MPVGLPAHLCRCLHTCAGVHRLAGPAQAAAQVCTGKLGKGKLPRCAQARASCTGVPRLAGPGQAAQVCRGVGVGWVRVG